LVSLVVWEVQTSAAFGKVELKEVCSGVVVRLLVDMVVHVRGPVQQRAMSVLGSILSQPELRR
jgi:hypothetical protein